MNYLAYILTALGVFLTAGLAVAETETIQGPRIAIDEPVFDFGEADNAQTIEHTFVIKNIGDTTLEIREVRPTCGCTVANISTKTLPPGGTSEITSRLSLPGRTGRQSKLLLVRSNDPVQPELRLTMAGTFTSAVQVTPDRFFFGQAEPSQTIDFEIDVNAMSDRPVTITELHPSDGITATTEVVEEGRRNKVRVSLTTPADAGVFNGSLRIVTDHPARRFIDIPVSGNIIGALIVAPPDITLSARHSRPVTRYIVLRAGTGGSFTLDGISLPSPDMRANVFPFGDAGFRIQLENVVASPELDGQEVSIRTTLASHPVVTVPFRIVD